MTTSIQMPCIHLNGTSAVELEQGYAVAFHSLMTALDKIEAMPPNARDYYPLDSYGAAGRKATEEHINRCAAIRRVADELNTLFRYCQTEREARENYLRFERRS